MPDSRLEYLFDRYIGGNCTEAERQEFFRLILQRENKELLLELINKVEDGTLIEMSKEKSDELYNRIRPQFTKVVSLFSFKKIAVAASILLMLGTGSYFLFFNKNKENEIVKTNDTVPHDITAPKGTKAIITLTDGRTVALDSINTGTIAIQGNVNVVKTADGKIIYQPAAGNRQSAVQYNTLSNPRGSKVIDMTLADGSRVWLNAGSSVTFPVAFHGNERKVSITGEAYFEVEHDASKPFIVSKGDVAVTVLGTHFNVNAYDDEESIKVTLLEGSVRITDNVQSAMLKPGQQAKIPHFVRDDNNKIEIANDVDLQQVMAWQKGLFEFSNTELPVIMRQIGRWYDVEIQYEGKPGNTKFGGGISKNLPLSDVLKLLQANGVKFELEGKVLKVKL